MALTSLECDRVHKGWLVCWYHQNTCHHIVMHHALFLSSVDGGHTPIHFFFSFLIILLRLLLLSRLSIQRQSLSSLYHLLVEGPTNLSLPTNPNPSLGLSFIHKLLGSFRPTSKMLFHNSCSEKGFSSGGESCLLFQWLASYLTTETGLPEFDRQQIIIPLRHLSCVFSFSSTIYVSSSSKCRSSCCNCSK